MFFRGITYRYALSCVIQFNVERLMSSAESIRLAASPGLIPESLIIMKKQFKTIDEYIGTFPRDIQSLLERMRQTIRKAAPEAVEAISYQMPTYKFNGKNLVHFAAWKNHIGFYPTPSGTEAFQKELSSYKRAKGSVQFPLDKPIPFGLVEKIVIFRVKEMLEAGIYRRRSSSINNKKSGIH